MIILLKNKWSITLFRHKSSQFVTISPWLPNQNLVLQKLLHFMQKWLPLRRKKSIKSFHHKSSNFVTISPDFLSSLWYRHWGFGYENKQTNKPPGPTDSGVLSTRGLTPIFSSFGYKTAEAKKGEPPALHLLTIPEISIGNCKQRSQESTESTDIPCTEGRTASYPTLYPLCVDRSEEARLNISQLYRFLFRHRFRSHHH